MEFVIVGKPEANNSKSLSFLQYINNLRVCTAILMTLLVSNSGKHNIHLK